MVPSAVLSSGPLGSDRSWGGLLPCLSSTVSLTETWLQWGEGGGHGTWISSPHFPPKPRLPRRAVYVSPMQCGLSAFVLHIGTFDSGPSEWGDLAKAPHTMHGLCEWRAGYQFWWEGLLKQNSFIFSAPNSEHFVKKKIPTEREFSGKCC